MKYEKVICDDDTAENTLQYLLLANSLPGRIARYGRSLAMLKGA